MLHRGAGLTIAADRRLPGFVLEPASSTAAADLRIHLELGPDWRTAAGILLHVAGDVDAAGRPIVTVSRASEGFHFAYADGTHAWIAAGGRDVWCTWPPTSSLDDVCTYLYGPILALVLRLRGSLALHASAVEFGGRAVGFVGPHGAGKSTLAAALGARGRRVITDDLLHLRRAGDGWIAEPFASMIKLWPEGARLAFDEPTDLPRIAEGWDKRALALGHAIPAACGARSLGALACFEEPSSHSRIEPLPPPSALLRLSANSAAAHLLDRDLRAAEFRALSALVRDVPCAALTPPADPGGYSRFLRQVVAWADTPDGHAAA